MHIDLVTLGFIVAAGVAFLCGATGPGLFFALIGGLGLLHDWETRKR